MKAHPVRITWNDAAHVGAGSWVDTADIDPRCRVVTVGVLIAHARGHHILAQSVQGEQATGVFTIPDEAIVRLQRLR